MTTRGKVIGMLALGAAAAAVIGLGGPWLGSRAYAWLEASDAPAPSDLIVVPAGGSLDRLVTAARLYRAGLAPAILVTDPTGYPETQWSFLRQQGVPPFAIVPPARPSTSTREDAESTRQVIVRKKVTSILVVTSPYHCRRARLLMSSALAGLDVEVRVIASESRFLDLRRWWSTREGWAHVGMEFFKLAWAWTRWTGSGGSRLGAPPGAPGNP